MPMPIQCTCGKQLQVPEDFVDQTVRCPGCGNPIAVTASNTAIQSHGRLNAAIAETHSVSGWPPIGRPFGSDISIIKIPTNYAKRGIIIFSLLIVVSFLAIVMLTVDEAREAAKRRKSSENLKVIALAMYAHQDTEGSFPPQAQNGLSWRVLLLPYYCEGPLHNQFHLDEPWDSPHNIRLLPQMPRCYVDPKWQQDEKAARANGLTYYQVYVTQKGATGQAIVGNEKPLTSAAVDIANGTANTFLVVEAGDPVPWTKPDDLPYSSTRALPPLGGPLRGDFLAVFADGHVLQIPAATSSTRLRRMINWQNNKPFVLPD